ncbi:MAG: protein-L-isoaspartate(D-aspartate) O-methyltransferase [Anaerolineae bacterium]|nr:protein-L-isoaspartate(D-aspartate) O-methyltransferase [Anaerolineae bacterium]
MIPEESALAQARANMVQTQLIDRNIVNDRVIRAMSRIPRHIFVDRQLWAEAYEDGPLPIGYGQTISQPYMVAYMTQALEIPPDREFVVLEIGTGSGYQTAILSQLVTQVYSVERIGPLADRARQCLDALNIQNVEIKVTDGGYGWQEKGPFDGIITTAAAPELPAPLALQLKEQARLIIPIGPKKRQKLFEYQRQGHKLLKRELLSVAFVPLIGEHGWEDNQPED